MVIYIAGPYRGDVDTNIANARKVAIELWEAKHAPICPHLNTAHFNDDCNIEDDDYIRGDLKILAKCDAAVFLPNWKKSAGATAEHNFCDTQKIPIFYWPDYPPAKHEPNRQAHPIEDFLLRANRRLTTGAIEYGDDSYLYNDVISEIEEELIDVANWSYLQWVKMQRLKTKIGRLEKHVSEIKEW